MSDTYDEVVRLALDRVPPAQIAVEIRCAPATVYHYIGMARRTGVDIPHFGRGGRRQAGAYLIPDQIHARLRPHAKARGLTVPQLIARLISVMAAAPDLIPTVLSDPEGPAHG